MTDRDQDLWQIGAVAYAGRRPSESPDHPLGMHLFLVLGHTEHGPTVAGAQEIFVPFEGDLDLEIGAIYHMRIVQGEGVVPQLRIGEDPEPVSFITDDLTVTEWLILTTAVEVAYDSRVRDKLGQSRSCQEALDLLLDPIRKFLSSGRIDESTRKMMATLIVTELITKK